MSALPSLPPIKFGTDGWRAVIAREFTFENLERVAQAFAAYLVSLPHDESNRLVVAGYDRRFLSEHFARRSAGVLAGNGFKVALFDSDMPTPVISWAVRDLGALAGFVITASHNPYDFNGFKIKAAWGGSAPPSATTQVEALVDAGPARRASVEPSSDSEMLARAVASYRRQIEAYVDTDRLRAAEGVVIVDPMHGTGGTWVESFLTGGRLNVTTIRANRDPLFGGVAPEPIDRNLNALKTCVIQSRAVAGLATDGDADRVGAVNELGETMTMHDVVPLMLLHLARNRRMTGGVVRTFSQSVLTKRIAQAHGLAVHETPIGFKYIAELMLSDDILIGAEESGGIGVKGHIPERDGVLNSLLFLEAIVAAGKSPSEMVREMHREFGEFYFNRRDLHCEVERGKDLVASLAAKPPSSFAGHAVTDVETLDGTKLLFADETWLLFRQSGTEPVLRIYCEATSREKGRGLLDAGEAFAR